MMHRIITLSLCSLLLTTPIASAWVTTSRSSSPITRTTAQHQSTSTRLSSEATSTESASASASASGQQLVITLDGDEIRAPIQPISNMVLVRVKDTLTATGGGILLPDQSKQRPTEGLVLAAGPGKQHPQTGVRIPNPVTEGMSVLYGKYDGKPVEYKGEECQLIRDDNVLIAYNGVTMRLDNVVAIRDYVLIQFQAVSDQPVSTKSGVVIAAAVLKDDKPCEGKVVKVGTGRVAASGEFCPPIVALGDMVKFKDYAGNEVMIEGKAYSVVKMSDILCTFLPVAEEAE